MPPICGPEQVGASALPSPPVPPLPPLPAQDRPLLARLFALSENYPALAAELATDAWNHLGESRPKDLLDLFAWSTLPHIAAWITHYRSMTDLQRRTLALDTLQTVIKTSDSPTEKRRAASTILRALDHRWPDRRPAPPSPRDQRGEVIRGFARTGEGRARVRTDSRSYVPPPPPRSTPQPNPDPAPALAAIREALSTPQAAVALSTIHEHAAPNAFFAGHPVSESKADWIAETPKQLPAGFRFPLTFLNHKELDRTADRIRYELWLLNLQRDRFRCNLSLIRDGPDHPSPCWRLAALDILQHNTG